MMDVPVAAVNHHVLGNQRQATFEQIGRLDSHEVVSLSAYRYCFLVTQ